MSTHGDRKIHAWMDGIAKEIPSVYVINVNAISVEPCRGPRVNQGEPKTAVLKTSRLAGEIGAAHVKRVATTKTGTEAVVRNPPMACRWLCSVSLLLPRRPGLLLCALLLLGWLRLLLCALLLGWLRLLLCALLLLGWLRLLLRALLLGWLRLLLCTLLLGWLSLLLRALRLRRPGLLLLLLWLLLLLALPLCVSRSNGSGKQEQTCYS